MNKESVREPSTEKVTVFSVAAYLAYLKSQKTDSDHKYLPFPPCSQDELPEPRVSKETKVFANAVAEALGSARLFMKRSMPRLLFQGWLGLTRERQVEGSIFFYKNKDAILCFVDDMVAKIDSDPLECESLDVWLQRLGVLGWFEGDLRKEWSLLVAKDEPGVVLDMDMQSLIIAQTLYRILYHCELAYHQEYCQPLG